MRRKMPILGAMWRAVFGRRLPLEDETTWYILVSALDVVVTYLLLRQGGFVEANPVARYFLYGWGIRGMVYFKFGMVAFVCLMSQIIALKNFEAAQRLLIFATLVVAGVVIYSVTLFLRHSAYL